MKKLAVVFLGVTMGALAQTGRITGTVTDDSGAAVAGAAVRASLRSSVSPGVTGPGGAPPFFPFPPVAASTATGGFEIDNLPAGKYTLCVEKPESTLLDPCLWTVPVTLDVKAGATASGVSVVMSQGVELSILVQDGQGLLANAAADDVRVGTSYGRSTFIPAMVYARDATGKTMKLVVPPGLPLNLKVTSASFTLADAKGNALGAGGQIPVAGPPAAAAGIAAPVGGPPAITVQVTGTVGKP